MDTGKIIRKLRTERNITQKELSHNICSRESLSKFERENTSISIDTFFKYLDRLNFDISEFSYFFLTDLSKKEKYKRCFVECIGADSTLFLRQLDVEFKKTNDIFYRMIYLELYLLNLYINNSFLKEENISSILEIKNYLYTVETWSKFEISLFANCMFIFDKKDILNMHLYAEKTICKYFKNSIYNKDEYCKYLLNLVYELIKRNEFKITLRIIKDIKKITLKENMLFYRLIVITLEKAINSSKKNNLIIDKELKILKEYGFKSKAIDLENFIKENIY